MPLLSGTPITLINDIQQLEKVQRCAAHWVLNDYSYMSAVSSMLKLLSWPTLKMRLKISRISMHIANYISSTITFYSTLPPVRTTRQYHPLRYVLPYSSITSYQQINDWNSLPTDLIEINNHASNLQSYTIKP